jgi:hypothetical protein
MRSGEISFQHFFPDSLTRDKIQLKNPNHGQDRLFQFVGYSSKSGTVESREASEDSGLRFE